MPQLQSPQQLQLCHVVFTTVVVAFAFNAQRTQRSSIRRHRSSTAITQAMIAARCTICFHFTPYSLHCAIPQHFFFLGEQVAEAVLQITLLLLCESTF